MGIKNLKYLFKNVKCYQLPTSFQTLVVDGNNLIVTFLCSAKSKVEKEYPISDWQGFSIDIVKQTKFILIEAYKMILNELKRFVNRYNIEEIWITFDPTKNMTYDIQLDKFNLVDPTYFNNLEHHENVISLNLKEEEHKKREQSRTTSRDKLHSTLSSIDDSEYYKELGDIELIKAIVKQSYGFNDSTLLHKLSRMLQKALISKSRFTLGMNYKDEREDFLNLNANIDVNARIYTARAKDEADLVIKNICNDIDIINNGKVNILVMSKDTDYKVLFADTPSIYITDLHCECFVPLFHPYSAWREILPSSITNVYDYVIRLAPIFGNDYTTGHGIITLSDNNDGVQLINALLNFDNKDLNKRTTLYKFLSAFTKTDGIITINELDNRIKLYMDKNYYTRYLQSVVIYTNFTYFHKFEISTKKFDFDVNLDFVYNNILLPAFDSIYEFSTTSNLRELLSSVNKLEDFKKSFYSEITISDEYFDW